MKVVSIVPSKGRPDGLSAKTLSWLCLSKHDFFIFVEPSDYEEYKRVVPVENLIATKQHGAGLAGAKQEIINWLADKDYDLVFKLDDDIWSMSGRGGRPAPESAAKQYDKAIADSIVMFNKYPHLGAVSFPYRWELYEIKKWVGMNARLQTAYLIRKDLLIAGCSSFEDFHNFIYLRSKNMMTLRYGLVGINGDVGTATGGLQSFDRQKMAQEEVAILRKIYPALQFKKVDKAWGIEPVLKGEFFGAKKL